uniref:Uncharacterized protein n=1 Tax=Timema shepardi TaxID=629360 RepID=A0A7R9B7U2_TIMSH|nr:unnamed protein product [Timema shepardi]
MRKKKLKIFENGMSVELSRVKEKKGDYSAHLNDHPLVVAIPGEMSTDYLDPYDMENSLRVDPEVQTPPLSDWGQLHDVTPAPCVRPSGAESSEVEMMAIEVQLHETGGALPDATGSDIPYVWDELDLIYQLIWHKGGNNRATATRIKMLHSFSSLYSFNVGIARCDPQ